MLYYLFEWFKEEGIRFPGSSLFQFISFRVMMAVLLSLMITMIYGKRIIRFLEKKQIISSLIVKGKDNVHTAMAKTVGLPLGIAAKLILNGTINLSGIHLPVIPKIYTPVLNELKTNGIIFSESRK